MGAGFVRVLPEADRRDLPGDVTLNQRAQFVVHICAIAGPGDHRGLGGEQALGSDRSSGEVDSRYASAAHGYRLARWAEGVPAQSRSDRVAAVGRTVEAVSTRAAG